MRMGTDPLMADTDGDGLETESNGVSSRPGWIPDGDDSSCLPRRRSPTSSSATRKPTKKNAQHRLSKTAVSAMMTAAPMPMMMGIVIAL